MDVLVEKCSARNGLCSYTMASVSEEESQAHNGAGDSERHDGRKVSFVGKGAEVGDEEQLENARKRYGDDE